MNLLDKDLLYKKALLSQPFYTISQYEALKKVPNFNYLEASYPVVAHSIAYEQNKLRDYIQGGTRIFTKLIDLKIDTIYSYSNVVFTVSGPHDDKVYRLYIDPIFKHVFKQLDWNGILDLDISVSFQKHINNTHIAVIRPSLLSIKEL